jgi:hypothetical protein
MLEPSTPERRPRGVSNTTPHKVSNLKRPFKEVENAPALEWKEVLQLPESEVLKKSKQRYPISFVQYSATKHAVQDINIEIPKSSSCANFTYWLREDLQCYPWEVIQESSLKRVIMTSRMDFFNVNARGFCVDNTGDLYIDVSSGDKLKLREAFHIGVYNFIHTKLSLKNELPEYNLTQLADSFSDIFIAPYYASSRRVCSVLMEKIAARCKTWNRKALYERCDTFRYFTQDRIRCVKDSSVCVIYNDIYIKEDDAMSDFELDE